MFLISILANKLQEKQIWMYQFIKYLDIKITANLELKHF